MNTGDVVGITLGAVVLLIGVFWLGGVASESVTKNWCNNAGRVKLDKEWYSCKPEEKR